MALLSLKVPEPTARVLSEIPLDQECQRESPGEFHITVLYLGKGVPVEEIARTIPVVFGVTSKIRPFTVSTSHATTFPPNPDDGVPIIAQVQSRELHALRQALCSAFDAAKIPWDKKYPDYKPHMTLAYSQDPKAHGKIDIDFPRVTWGAHELSLWGGDHGEEKLAVTFPFSIANTKAATNRAFVQLAKGYPRYLRA